MILPNSHEIGFSNPDNQSEKDTNAATIAWKTIQPIIDNYKTLRREKGQDDPEIEKLRARIDSLLQVAEKVFLRAKIAYTYQKEQRRNHSYPRDLREIMLAGAFKFTQEALPRTFDPYWNTEQRILEGEMLKALFTDTHVVNAESEEEGFRKVIGAEGIDYPPQTNLADDPIFKTGIGSASRNRSLI